MPSEVALPLAVFHRRLARAVIGPRLATLGDPRGGDLGDHLRESSRRRLDRARATDIADRAVPDHRLESGLVVGPVRVPMVGEQDAVALEYRPAVREVDGGDLKPLPGDVIPDVELGPVR